MATSYLTDNMSLVIPVPGSEAGPTWASDLNASLTILDSHTHASGSGVAITPSAININSDLGFNSYNITALRSVRLSSNSAALALTVDKGCLYEAGVDLYYNDGSGNQIRITQSGSVAGSSGTITGLPSGTASAAYSGSNGTFQFQQATSTAGNLDAGSIAIRYPGSYPTPSGNYIQLQAPSSLASGYTLTLPALPGQTNVMTLSSAGVIGSSTYDSIGSSMTSTGANAIAASMNATGANAIGSSMTSTGANAVATSRTRATGTSVGIGGVAVSAASGSSGTSSGSDTLIANQSITIVSSGRPILVMLQSTSSSYPGGYINVACATNTTGADAEGIITLYRNGSPLRLTRFTVGRSSSQNSITIPASLSIIDTTVGAGTWTYSWYNRWGNTGSGGNTITNVETVAYEL